MRHKATKLAPVAAARYRDAQRARRAARWAGWTLSLWVLLLAASPSAGEPRGAKVVHGQASVHRQGRDTTIRAGHNAVIEYQQFDVARRESVRFVQPGPRARVLNRVIGPDPSRIAGTLRANGQVYLVNPAGVFFARGSVVDVGALYAAAGNLRTGDFLAGRDRFTQLSGPVVNEGTITASTVALIGSQVANYGTVVAEEGHVTLAAGENVVILSGDGHYAVEVSGAEDAGDADAAAGEEAQVTNAGALRARRGVHMLAAGDEFSLALRQEASGSAKAPKIELHGGRGEARVSGALDASNTDPGGRGGEVTVTGRRVGLVEAELDASGDAGGGSVRVGGGFQGKDETLGNARAMWVGPDSRLRADALADGDGGRVIVWGVTSVRVA